MICTLTSAGADTLPLKIRKNKTKTQTNLHILGWALGILKNCLFFWFSVHMCIKCSKKFYQSSILLRVFKTVFRYFIKIYEEDMASKKFYQRCFLLPNFSQEGEQHSKK